MDLQSAYAGRRVFITGHTGFKGAWLAEWLGSLGAVVTGFALEPPTKPSLFHAIGLGSRIEHVVGDVRDRAALAHEVERVKPAFIFHLAARALVLGGYREPQETFETNVMGTVNVLDIARRCDSVRSVVVITSDKVYENSETGRPFRETDPLGGRDPYAASKASAELVTAAYRHSFFANGAAIASARAGNVIGGGDWAPDRIIPDSVRALVAGEPIVVRNPDAIRPWQHVLDPITGYLMLGARLATDGHAFDGGWNFGPRSRTQERPVRWVVDRFIREWGSGTWKEQLVPGTAPAEAQRLSLDSRKAHTALGWTPAWDGAEAVRRTAAWYREYYRAPANARELVDEQLGAYQADANIVVGHVGRGDGGTTQR